MIVITQGFEATSEPSLPEGSIVYEILRRSRGWTPEQVDCLDASALNELVDLIVYHA